MRVETFDRLLLNVSIVSAFALAFIVFGSLIRYGTLDPCEMVRHDFMAYAERRFGAIGGMVAGAQLARAEREHDALQDSGQCVRAWVRLQFADVHDLDR